MNLVAFMTAVTRANGMVLPGVTTDGSENTVSVDPQTYDQTKWRVAGPNTYNAG